MKFMNKNLARNRSRSKIYEIYEEKNLPGAGTGRWSRSRLRGKNIGAGAGQKVSGSTTMIASQSYNSINSVLKNLFIK